MHCPDIAEAAVKFCRRWCHGGCHGGPLSRPGKACRVQLNDSHCCSVIVSRPATAVPAQEHQRLCTQVQHMSGSSVEVACGLQCTCRGRLGRSSVPARSCVDSCGTDAQACVICAPGPHAGGDAPSRSPLHLPSAGWDDSRRIVSPEQQNSTCAGLLLRQRHALGAHQWLARLLIITFGKQC